MSSKRTIKIFSIFVVAIINVVFSTISYAEGTKMNIVGFQESGVDTLSFSTVVNPTNPDSGGESNTNYEDIQVKGKKFYAKQYLDLANGKMEGYKYSSNRYGVLDNTQCIAVGENTGTISAIASINCEIRKITSDDSSIITVTESNGSVKGMTRTPKSTSKAYYAFLSGKKAGTTYITVHTKSTTQIKIKLTVISTETAMNDEKEKSLDIIESSIGIGFREITVPMGLKIQNGKVDKVKSARNKVLNDFSELSIDEIEAELNFEEASEDEKKESNINTDLKVELCKAKYSITANSNKQIYIAEVSPQEGKYVIKGWNFMTIHKDQEYNLIYTFAFLPTRNKMYYTLTKWSPVDGVEYDDDFRSAEERASDDSMEEISDLVEEEENRLKVFLTVMMDRINEDERGAVDTPFENVLDNPDFYTEFEDLESEEVEKVEETAGQVLSVITNIGAIVSFLVPAILGIKYMIGSVEDKAEYKKDIIPYLVGAVLLFGICTVVKMLQILGNKINEI